MFARIISSLGAASAAALAMTGAALAAASPMGVWIDHTGRGAVEIKDCGDGSLCGRVVWIKDQADSRGCGLQILGSVAPVGSGQWDNGWIYSPEKKQKFSVEVTALDDKRLRVKGYKGIKLLSKTMIWHRAPSDLKRCSKGSTTAAVAPTELAPKSNPVAKQKPLDEKRANPEPTPAPAANRAPSATLEPTPKPAEPEVYEAAPAPGEDIGRTTDNAEALPGERDDQGAKPRRRGLAGLLQEFDMEDGIDVGDNYGLDVEKGPEGEKTCLLKVPFVTVEIPCDE